MAVAEAATGATLQLMGRRSHIQLGDGTLSVTCPGSDIGTQYAVMNDAGTQVHLQFQNMPTDCIDVPTGVPCAAEPSLTTPNVVPAMFYCVFEASAGIAFEGPYRATRVKDDTSGKLAAILTCDMPLGPVGSFSSKLFEITSGFTSPMVNVTVMHGIHPDFLELPFVGYAGGNTLTVSSG
jgi:hypothetical protein